MLQIYVLASIQLWQKKNATTLIVGMLHCVQLLCLPPSAIAASGCTSTSVPSHFGPFAINDRSGCPVRSFVTSVLCQFGP